MRGGLKISKGFLAMFTMFCLLDHTVIIVYRTTTVDDINPALPIIRNIL